MKKQYLSFLTLLIFLLSSCAAKKPYLKNSHSSSNEKQIIPIDNIDYELFLVGDIGAAKNNLAKSDIVDLIKTELRGSDIKQSVVFLGNSISENGFPDEEAPEYDKMDAEIKHCIDVLKGYTDKVFFIPGNSEWFDGHEYTSSALNHVENYIESKVGGKDIFAPSDGCGEPKLVELTDDLLLLLIDSQWILEGDRSGQRKRARCEIDYAAELVSYIEEKLSKNKNKNVIIAAHHPIYSNGKTGGNYGLASNLLPLPILGSLITGIKKLSGGQQKFGHPQYEAYRTVIKEAISNYEGIIISSAHDKNLQYHFQDDNHFVVSGSGADVDFVRKGGTSSFAYMKQGFSKITHTKDLELWLEFYVPDPQNPKKAVSVFRKMLYKKEIIDYSDTTVYHTLNQYEKTHITKASEVYAKRIPGMGKTYRKEWGTELEVPVLLLEEHFGGLTPIQQGGGFQTKSLRLENPDGQQWVLRTIDKDVVKVVPSLLRGTFAQDLIQDGISASHPYGAMVIPKLAEAAKIYHANPSTVWVPKQKALGDYNIDFGDRLYLFEERAGGNVIGHPTFGNTTKAISTPDLLKKLSKNHKHKVDEKHVLKSRLFDILIGDWDRHDDQWRWAEFEDKETDQTIYRAIPRDRDQVFFKNDGFLNYIASRPYFTPSLSKFDSEIGFMSGLIYNARHFDRSFLSQMDKVDFINLAKELQKDLTDQAIENAFKDWSKEIYDISGPDIIKKLKQRRADLPKYAEEFYKVITKEVTAVGTYGTNIFDITTLPDDKLDVNVYHVEDGTKHLIWSRMISGEDCDELILYGLNKNDTFNFTGDENSTVKIRLIGGSGEDVVNNNSKGNLEILVYDRKDGIELSGNEVKSKLRNRRGINKYDRMDWEINRTLHFPMLAFYTDEGLGVSYNLWSIRNGFRKSPYKSNHVLSLAYFNGNSSLIGNYNGHWVSVFGPDWDVKLGVEATGPVFTQFFYGLGNEYINFETIFPNEPNANTTQFFIVKGSHVNIRPEFVGDLGNGQSFSFRPSIEFLNIKNRANDPDDVRFIFLEEAGLSSFDFEDKLYVGMGLNYTNDRINDKIIPTRGFKFEIGANYRQSISDSKYSNVNVASNLQAYVPFSPTHRLVLATDIGGAYNFGDYEFFHANYLATRERLRGFKRNRFAGDGILYVASDLRFKIFQGYGGLRTGLGIFGSYDIGRAFLDEDTADTWHTSVGGGIFLTPLDLIGFKFGYYVGREDVQLVIGGALSF